MKDALMHVVVIIGLFWGFSCWGCAGPEKTDKMTAAAPKAAAKKTTPASPAKPTPSAPKKVGSLSVDKTEYDFGDVKPNSKVNGKFILTNTGKAPLEIQKTVRKSCGCTVPKLKDYTLQPGQSTALFVTFSVGSHPGKTSKLIWVDVKPPATPKTLKLSITANVKKIVAVQPEELLFEIRPNPQLQYVLKLQSTDNKPFSITGFATHGKVATANFDEQQNDPCHVVTIKIDPQKLGARKNGVLTLNINHPDLKTIAIPYKSVLPFSAHPPTRAFLRMKPGETKEEYIKVVSNFGEKFEIAKVASAKGLVKVLKTTQTEDGYKIDIAFTTPAESKGRFLQDELTIKIKDHPETEVVVKCYANISKHKPTPRPLEIPK